jgi:hypothetical protein
MNAAKALDMKTLLANEKFISVLNNPTISEIKQSIKKEEDPQN